MSGKCSTGNCDNLSSSHVCKKYREGIMVKNIDEFMKENAELMDDLARLEEFEKVRAELLVTKNALELLQEEYASLLADFKKLQKELEK